ncbi:MAG: flagellar motor protein MotD [Chromatiales bacterium]|nr:flagellar motor protein MotD [Gammaproteobacteria bacterium]MBW6476296.1 flagellar motor protein MotD [Chromatiales bacterium]
MRRRRRPQEHENTERWLISYADFITLLFAFFVVMYAISSVNEGKYRVLSDTLVTAFGSPSRSLEPLQIGEEGLSGQPGIFDAGMRSTTPVGNLGQIADDFERVLQSLIEQDLIRITRDENWIEIEINTSLLYGSGSADLEPEALPILRRLAGILRQYPNPIQVEGFTDNVPIATMIYPSNWELSAARAASVVNLFTRTGVDPGRMVAVGYGEYRPIADNATAEGRRQNRRVVLVVSADERERRLLGGSNATGGGE